MNKRWGGAQTESILVAKYADQWCKDNGYPIQRRRYVSRKYERFKCVRNKAKRHLES
jgi:hypothetical protein